LERPAGYLLGRRILDAACERRYRADESAVRSDRRLADISLGGGCHEADRALRRTIPAGASHPSLTQNIARGIVINPTESSRGMCKAVQLEKCSTFNLAGIADAHQRPEIHLEHLDDTYRKKL
jgi:hypothetical protein